MYFKISIISRLLDFFGRVLIGSPASILYSDDELEAFKKTGRSLPGSNFYLKPGDRQMPAVDKYTWRVQRNLKYEDEMRMQVKKYAPLFATIVSVVFSAVGALGFFASRQPQAWIGYAFWTLVTAIGVWVAYSVFIRRSFPSLSTLMPLGKMREAAHAETNAVTVRTDVPHGKQTTKDLDDLEGRYDLTPEGYRVTGRLLAEDISIGSSSPATTLPLAFAPFIMGLVVTLNATQHPFLAALLLLGFGVFLVRSVGFGFVCGLIAAGLIVPAAATVLSNAFGLSGIVDMLMVAGAIVVLSLPVLYNHLEVRKRAKRLMQQGQVANAASSGTLTRAHVPARRKQAAGARRDKTPFIPLGTALGAATKKRDGYSPDAGMTFGYTLKDSGLHTMIFGKSGTGKTSSMLIPILRTALCNSRPFNGVLSGHVITEGAEKVKMGLLCMDNKGSLPFELSGIRSDYVVLEPETSNVNPLFGLTPEQRFNGFLNVVSEKVEGNQNAFFISNGQTWVRHGFVFHYHLCQMDKEVYEENLGKYDQFTSNNTTEEIESLLLTNPDLIINEPKRLWKDNMAVVDDIFQLMNQHSTNEKGVTTGESFIVHLAKKMAECYAPAQEPGLLADAITYITSVLPAMTAEERGKIKAQVDSWMAPLKSNSYILNWLNAEGDGDYDVGNVIYGAAYGINTPMHRYGRAGLIMSNLLKERVYSAIINRPDGDHWTEEDGYAEVMICVDEYQESASKSEDNFFAKSRSKKARGLFATQSIDTLIEKMGEKVCMSFLGNITNVGTFKATPATYEFISKRLGNTENVYYRGATMGIDYVASTRQMLGGPAFDPTHPYSSLMRHRNRSLINRFGKIFKEIVPRIEGAPAGASSVADHLHSMITNVEFKMELLFSSSEIEAILQEPFVALMQVERAGVSRRDFIRTNVVDIKTGNIIDIYKVNEEEDEAA